VVQNGIAYLSCNPSDYMGNLHASDLFNQVQQQGARAVILYTTAAMTCNYSASGTVPMTPFIYAMSQEDDSATLLNTLNEPTANGFSFTAIIDRSQNNSNGTDDNDNQGNNPLGPSPSTAVAMIILYSITGVITALFLVIIVTGAVRAHRHPERYGPRNILGRPRQSRAKGLARAMLDTLPIVKFGERPQDKANDVELATGAGTAGAGGVTQASNETAREGPTTADEPSSAPAAHPPSAQGEDINPAQTAANATTPGPAATGAPAADDKEGQGCSICTDDFERGQDIRVLPCNHQFHPACVDPWLLNVSGTCPLCRIDLHPAASPTEDTERDDVSRSNSYAPPLTDPDEPEGLGSRATRRISMLRNVLHLRTAEERAAALRELREDAETRTGDASAEGNAASRRRSRLTERLQDVFRVRTRRNEDDSGEGSNATRGN
jgi:hypothetical protein